MIPIVLLAMAELEHACGGREGTVAAAAHGGSVAADYAMPVLSFKEA
jgi:hypothetical protein